MICFPLRSFYSVSLILKVISGNENIGKLWAFDKEFIILKINHKTISKNEELEEILIECVNKIVDKVEYWANNIGSLGIADPVSETV